MLRRTGTAALLMLLGLGSGELQAQARIDGVLIDSTRSLAPLANAEVVLMADGRRATTDGRGRFTFSDVPAGVQRVAYAALWMDSVGVPVVVREVAVPANGRVRVALSTTARSTLERQACGTSLEPDIGLLVGEVRDALGGLPAAAVVVEARWTERRLGRGLNEVHAVATVDTTDDSGRYALCGVPPNVGVTVSASHPDGRVVSPLLVTMDSHLGALDLAVGGAERTMIVSGRVTGPTGTPLPRANVATSWDTAQPLVTDSTGRFRFQVPARSGQVYVRTLGYQPLTASFMPVSDEVSVGDLRLQPVGAVLDTRIITARPRTKEEAEFQWRRSLGMGSFLDSTEMARWPRISATTVAAHSRGWVRAIPVSQGGDRPALPFPALMVRGARGYCMPPVWVDGDPWGNLDVFDQYSLLSRAIRLELYRAPFIPIEFNDNNDCGALVVWTR
ncbi:MAG: hypothetical protein C0503_02205 [Gemmatimonas sp.]|nr:hypothetical protein [Gemmatimonas sp.]